MTLEVSPLRWARTQILPALYKLWKLLTSELPENLCLAMWNLILHIFSLVFSNRVKGAPMQMVWAPCLHSSLLSDTLSCKSQAPQTSWTQLSVSSTQKPLYSAWAFPPCTMAQKVAPGRRLMKPKDFFVGSLLSTSIRDHRLILSTVQYLTMVEVFLSLLILLLKLFQILSVRAPSDCFKKNVLLLCPHHFFRHLHTFWDN